MSLRSKAQRAKRFADANKHLTDDEFISKLFEGREDMFPNGLQAAVCADTYFDDTFVNVRNGKKLKEVEPIVEAAVHTVELPPHNPLIDLLRKRPDAIIEECIDHQVFRDLLPGVMIAFTNEKYFDETVTYIRNAVKKTALETLEGLSCMIVNKYYGGEVCHLLNFEPMEAYLKRMPHYLVRTYQDAPKLCNHGLRQTEFRATEQKVPSWYDRLYEPVLAPKSLDDELDIKKCIAEIEQQPEVPRGEDLLILVEEEPVETYLALYDHPKSASRHSNTPLCSNKEQILQIESEGELVERLVEGHTNFAIRDSVKFGDSNIADVGENNGDAVYVHFNVDEGWEKPELPPIGYLPVPIETDRKYNIVNRPQIVTLINKERAKAHGAGKASRSAGSRRLGDGLRRPRLSGNDGLGRSISTKKKPWLLMMLLHHMLSTTGTAARNECEEGCSCPICRATRRVKNLYKKSRKVYAEQFYRAIKGHSRQHGRWLLVSQWLLQNGADYSCNGHLVVPVDTAGH